MSLLFTTAAALFSIAGLITVHEFGHFLAAKAMGVRVKVFSVGIGGRLVGYEWRGTDYRLSWIPFGGYVRMAGADPFMEGGADPDEAPGAPGSFMDKPAWRRLVIVLAGPAMNLALPFVFFTALKVAGDPQPRADVGAVQPGSAAETAGFLPEDRVVEVAGTRTLTWLDVAEAVGAAPGPTVDLRVDRQGSEVPLQLAVAEGRQLYELGLSNNAPDSTVGVDDPASPAARGGLHTGDLVLAVGGTEVRNWNETRRLALAAGDTLELRVRHVEAPDAAPETLRLQADASWVPQATPADDVLWSRWGFFSAMVTIGSVGDPDEPPTAAARVGLRKGDHLVAVDDTPIRNWQDVVVAVSASATGEGQTQKVRSLRVTYRRDGQVAELEVTPDVVRDLNALGRYWWRPLLGISGGASTVAAPLVPRPYPFFEALGRASDETLLLGTFMLEQIGKMTTGEAPPQENLGGFVSIFREVRSAAEQGVYEVIRRVGLFSLSIGIINLLPVPLLDGGQIVMYGAEWIRGRPLPLVLRERAQQVGFIFLVLLMLFVFANDIRKAAMG